MLGVIGMIVGMVGLSVSPAIGDTTYVGGRITTDTTWTLAGSPYIVIANVHLDSGVTLQIEPGVEVKFGTLPGWHDTLSLIVNGRLLAEGEEGNLITFTSILESPEPGSWGWLKFESGSVGRLVHCEISYGGGLLSSSDSLTITNSTIAHSEGIRNSGTLTITNSTIAHNYFGIWNSGTLTITNSTIAYNHHYGILNRGFAVIEGCVIRKNRDGIKFDRGSGIIRDNLIIYQERDGIEIGDIDSLLIEGNRIANNGRTGIFSSGDAEIRENIIADNDMAIFNMGNSQILHNTITRNSSGIFNSGNPIINHNNISENDPYWVNNRTWVDIDASNNWWATTDTLLINQFIYDQRDDVSFGLVHYTPILEEPDTIAPPPSPRNLQADITVKSEKGFPTSISLSWDSLSLTDLGGYRLHYDNNPGHPYSGLSANEGVSPIDVGHLTQFELTGLSPEQTYYITVIAYDNQGNESLYSNEVVVPLTGVEEDEIDHLLFYTYPNPTRGEMFIGYRLAGVGTGIVPVRLKIYDIRGALVKSLVDRDDEPGHYTMSWDRMDDTGKEVGAGIYFLRLSAGELRATRKLVILQ